MSEFFVPVVVVEHRSTVAVVRVDASSEREADDLAELIVGHALETDPTDLLCDLHSPSCDWQNDGHYTQGIDNDRLFRSGDYGPEIDAIEDPGLIPPDPKQRRLFDAD